MFRATCLLRTTWQYVENPSFSVKHRNNMLTLNHHLAAAVFSSCAARFSSLHGPGQGLPDLLRFHDFFCPTSSLESWMVDLLWTAGLTRNGRGRLEVTVVDALTQACNAFLGGEDDDLCGWDQGDPEVEEQKTKGTPILGRHRWIGSTGIRDDHCSINGSHLSNIYRIYMAIDIRPISLDST